MGAEIIDSLALEAFLDAIDPSSGLVVFNVPPGMPI